MFYFKGEKREIRRPIIKVFSKLNVNSFCDDNYIVTSKLQGNKINLIRLHSDTPISYPTYFTHEDLTWDSKGITCVGVQYYFFKCVSIESEIKNIDGLFYEFSTMEVDLVKSFVNKREYEFFKLSSMDLKSRQGFLLEEQIVQSLFEANKIFCDIKLRRDMTRAAFEYMELLIEKSISINSKKLAS